ncbi:MAG: hypothetical protein Q3963_07435, partial [Coriobacteriaceae bacterium]|nr:hypothetical protein [Coriobacteriaceae bacterium]
QVTVNENCDTITYKQEGFSVTGYVVNRAPQSGEQVMLLAKYNGKYYIINSNGSLTEVPYDAQTGNISGEAFAGKVTVDNPLLWTYHYEYGGHFRIAS